MITEKVLTVNEVKSDALSCNCLKDFMNTVTDVFVEQVEPFIDEAANQGWVVFDPWLAPYGMRLMLKAINTEKPFCKEHFVAVLSRVMRRYYLSRPNIEAMREEWDKHEWSRVRWPIFVEAIECYKRGAYFASISTTAPLVEGIVTFREEIKPFSKLLD